MTDELERRLTRLSDIAIPDPEPTTALRRRAARRKHRRIAWSSIAALGAVGVTVGIVEVADDDGPSRVESVDDSSEDQTPEGWRPLAPSPIEGRVAAAIATDGRRMFVWGGTGGTRGSFADGAIYDPQTDSWETVPEAPDPMRGPSGRAVWDGSRFLVVATDFDTPLALAAYDPSTHEWQRLADPPLDQRQGFNATWTGTELIVTGGGSGDTIADTFGAIYDPRADSWRALPPPPYEHYTGGAAVWQDDELTLVGGASSAGGTSADPQTAVPGARYEPGTPGTWTALPAGPVAGARWAIPTTDGVIVLGDEAGDGRHLRRGLLRLDELQWSDIAPIEQSSPVLDVVADGTGGYLLVTGRGGLRATGQSDPEPLPDLDLSDRVVASAIVVGRTLIVWGGLNSEQTGALADGYALHLDAGSTPTSTTPPPSSEEEAFTTAIEAERAGLMVRDFFAALAQGDWERAASYFGSSGGHPLEFGADIAGTPYENTQLGALVRLEPELADDRDLPGLLRAWCQRHDGPCFEVDEITDVEQVDARPTLVVSVRLRDPDGNVVEFVGGSSVAALTVGWFEGERYLSDLPPTIAG